MPFRTIGTTVLACALCATLPAWGAEGHTQPTGGRGVRPPHSPRPDMFTVSLVPVGSSTPAIGTPIAFRVATSRTGYVHLYALDASGKTQVWLENVGLRAGAPLTVPPRGLTIRATPPAGDDTIVLLATSRPIDGFAGAGTTTKPVDTQLTHDGFRQALAEKTRALPRSSWAFTETQIRVRD